jgi:hypothetical protein
VPLVRPSSMTTADVEMVLMALVQPEGDTRSGAGRAGTPEPRVVLSESQMLGLHVARMELTTPHCTGRGRTR